MKKLFFAVVLPLILLSCGKFEEEDFGYPKDVTFSSNGGEQVISVDDAEQFSHVVIIDYNTAAEGMYITNDDGSGYNELEWLRVETESRFSTKLKIIAEPNTTGEKRKLWIELISAYKYHVIEVEQS